MSFTLRTITPNDTQMVCLKGELWIYFRHRIQILNLLITDHRSSRGEVASALVAQRRRRGKQLRTSGRCFDFWSDRYSIGAHCGRIPTSWKRCMWMVEPRLFSPLRLGALSTPGNGNAWYMNPEVEQWIREIKSSALTMHGHRDGRAMMAEGITVQSLQHKAFARTCES